MLDLNNHFVRYIVENHMQWRECREDYHSAVTEPGSRCNDAQGHARSSKDDLKVLLALLPRREKKTWTKLGRRGSLTGIACFHRAVQVELLLFHEEIRKGQK